MHLFQSGSKVKVHKIELPESYFFKLCMFSGFRFDREGDARHPQRMIAYIASNGSLVLEPLYSNIHILRIQEKKLKHRPSRFFVGIPSDWLESAAKQDKDLREPAALEVEFDMVNARKSMPIRLICKPVFQEYPYYKKLGRRTILINNPNEERRR